MKIYCSSCGSKIKEATNDLREQKLKETLKEHGYRIVERYKDLRKEGYRYKVKVMKTSDEYDEKGWPISERALDEDKLLDIVHTVIPEAIGGGEGYEDWIWVAWNGEI